MCWYNFREWPLIPLGESWQIWGQGLRFLGYCFVEGQISFHPVGICLHHCPNFTLTGFQHTLLDRKTPYTLYL